MRKNKHIKIAIFLLMFFNVSIGQFPLEIRNNSVIGIGGIIIYETTLYEVRNFQFVKQEGNHRFYETRRQVGEATAYMTVTVEGNLVVFVAVATEANDENLLQEIYRMTYQERKARLGYPSTELSGVYAWTYPITRYVLSLYRDDTGKLQIFEMIGIRE